ncbi:MAG: twin-arginine translocase subunit TatC [Candidatus Methanoperedens sp.]|nr:twin-arginine translocase subunit TatC [Candidatus Methanoperedens sp.]
MSNVPGDHELPIEEHFVELRLRMMTVAIPIIVITSIVFIFSGNLLKIMWDWTIPGPMTVYSPMELIITRMVLSLMFALFVGVPLLVYEGFLFMGKGLYPNEKMFFIKIIPFSSIMFLAGALLGFFIFVPILFKYTMVYSSEVAIPQISVLKAMTAIITTVLGFGLIFQLPLIFIFSIKMGLLKKEFFIGKRKFIYSGLLAIAIFVSPDPTAISELLMAVVLVILFEFSLLIARYF